MPKKVQKKKNQKLKKETLKRIEKVANAYHIYEERLSTRASMNADEKNELIKQFMENFKDEITAVIDNNNLTADKNDALAAKGLNPIAQAFVSTYKAFCEDNDMTKPDDSFKHNSEAYDLLKDDIAQNAEAGSTNHEEGSDIEASEAQAAGLRDIAMFLYKNAEGKTASRRGDAHLGKDDNSQFIFVEGLLSRSVKQRLLIFYLIEHGKTKSCSVEDVIKSQVYVPNVEVFKKKMLRSGIARLLSKVNVKWSLLGTAIQTAGVAIDSSTLPKDEEGEPLSKEAVDAEIEALNGPYGAGGEYLSSRTENVGDNDFEVYDTLEKTLAINNGELGEDQEQKQELINDLQNDEESDPALKQAVVADKKENPVSPEQIAKEMKLLTALSQELREMIEASGDANKKKDPDSVTFDINSPEALRFQQLKSAIAKIQGHITEHVNSASSSNPDAHRDDKINNLEQTNTSILKKLSDAMGKLPKAETLAVGSAISLIAILVKVGGLIKNGKNLSPGDLAERLLSLTAACADFAGSTSKAVLVTQALASGSLAAFQAASTTATTVTGALGVASGGLSMAMGFVNSGKADALRKGTNKADDHLRNAYLQTDFNGDEKQKRDIKFAQNISGFIRSEYHTKAIKAGRDVVGGTLTALGGALSLTAVGAVVGIPLMLVGLGTTLIGTVAQKITAKVEKTKTVDRFLGVDGYIETLSKLDAFKGKKDALELIRKELRKFGMAKMGAASENQAYNIIMSRYAHFLYEKTFRKKDGTYKEASYYDRPPDGPEGETEFACRDLVSALGVKMKFSVNGEDEPKTKEYDIRRRMIL